MICQITDSPCRTNGCGEKCYKKDSLGYSTAPQHDAKLPVISHFFIGQKISSVYKMNSGYTVLEIDEKRDRILMRQDGIDKPQWFTLSEFQNG